VQLAGRRCDVCEEPIPRADEARACVACAVAVHRACAAECPRCGERMWGPRKLAARAKTAEREAHASAWHEGRRLLIAASISYVLTSLTLTIGTFSTTGDLGNLATGGVRLCVGMAGLWWISRGSVAAARVAIALAALGGGGSMLMAAFAPTWDAALLSLLFGALFLGIAFRLGTSQPFWTYVRAQRDGRSVDGT
jgi:hypothetical protein